MAGAIAQLLQRAKLASQGTPQTTTVVQSSAVAPSSPTGNFSSILAGHRIMDIPTNIEMLNANRPSVDEIPAPAIGSPAPSVPALQSASQTATTIAGIDWKKYLPWILIVVALVVVLAATRKRSA